MVKPTGPVRANEASIEIGTLYEVERKAKDDGLDTAGRYALRQEKTKPCLDPFAYLRDLLQRIPTHPNQKIQDLLPDSWKTLED